MLSYHRVLEVFGRSINDKTLECDCDIHPWEITVDEKTWPGRIRLIGFVDVFFIISYSANDRFMKGIIIYKDATALKKLDEKRPVDKDTEGKVEQTTKNEGKIEEKEVDDNRPDSKGSYDDFEGNSSDFDFDFRDSDEDDDDMDDALAPSGSTADSTQTTQEKAPPLFEFKERSVYKIKSLGHEIGMKTTYATSSIKKYTIEINRPESWALSRRMKRGLKSHGIGRMMQDVVRCGLITQSQLIGHMMGTLVTGGRWNDTFQRSFQGIGSGDCARRQALSNEKL